MLWFLKRIKIRPHEIGLIFRDGAFRGLLDEGVRWFVDPLNQIRVEVVSTRATWFVHPQLDEMVRSGELKGRALVLDLKDHQRGLVWVDGRFARLLGPGLHACWTDSREVRAEVVDARRVRFEHEALKAMLGAPGFMLLDQQTVKGDHVGVLYVDGHYAETLPPGRYAFWKGMAEAKVVEVDLREATIDVGGQEMMTLDKVTLRLNAMATYRVADPRRAVAAADDARQALYREVQLALRAVVGARELDAFLTDKEAVAGEAEGLIRRRAEELGLELKAVGIRDVILPGEMKELMNKVTEARKAAEAQLITRREETAAMRSQANTARLLADNPTLMRLRELELLEKIAAGGQLSVMLGEKGLAERVVNLL